MFRLPTSRLNFPQLQKWLRVRERLTNVLTSLIALHKVRSAMLSEKQEAAHTAALQKQAMRAEADAFRGVHLDPNAHHWDEVSFPRVTNDWHLNPFISRWRRTMITFWQR